MHRRRSAKVSMIFVLVLAAILTGCLGGGTETKYTLEIAVEGEGTTDPSPKQYEYSKATIVELTAKPAAGMEFSHWEGGVLQPSALKTEVYMDGNKSVKAVFVKPKPLGEPVEVKSGEALVFPGAVALDLKEVELTADTKVTVRDATAEVEAELPKEELKPAGAAITVNFDGADNSHFSKGVTLRLPLAEGAKTGNTGVFHKVGDHWEYEETEIVYGFALATVKSFSTYAVLEAETVKAPTSSAQGTVLEPGTEIVLSTETEGAEIYISTGGKDFPEDFRRYEMPLVMPPASLEVHPVAVKANMIQSEIKTFSYRPSGALEGLVIKIVDPSGKGIEGLRVNLTDRPDPVYTDKNGMVTVESSADEVIAAPQDAGYAFEPEVLFWKPGEDELKFVAAALSEAPKQHGIFELTFNPVTFEDESKFNPFASAKIREAMNRFIDREYILQSAKGDVKPILTFIDPLSFEQKFMADELAKLEEKYAFDKAAAQAVIKAEMEEMGAELTEGKWHYQGEAVELIFIIRSEDIRENIGNYIADELESIGFNVRRKYMTGAEAGPVFMLGDPRDGAWHLVTGAWTSSSHVPLQGHLLEQMYTSLYSMEQPLWQAYDPSPELVKIAEGMYHQNFTSAAERRETFAEGLELALKHSSRIWLIWEE